MDALSDLDQQHLTHLHTLLCEDLDALYDTERQLAAATRPQEKRQLRRDVEQIRANYTRLREEYAGLLRKAIPTCFTSDEQPLIQTVVERLNTDQLIMTHTALQEVDRDPNNPELTRLSTELVTALPSLQQQLVVQNTPEAKRVAHIAQILQAPTVDHKQKLKLSLPLLPLFLAYETELNLNVTANLKAAWERLRERFRP